MCEYLIVGVNDDDLVHSYKHKRPTISCADRMEIVKAISHTDKVVKSTTLDKMNFAIENNVDCIFIGDDWANSDRWNKDKETLAHKGIAVEFLPYTQNISTTELVSIIREIKYPAK